MKEDRFRILPGLNNENFNFVQQVHFVWLDRIEPYFEPYYANCLNDINQICYNPYQPAALFATKSKGMASAQMRNCPICLCVDNKKDQEAYFKGSDQSFSEIINKLKPQVRNYCNVYNRKTKKVSVKFFCKEEFNKIIANDLLIVDPLYGKDIQFVDEEIHFYNCELGTEEEIKNIFSQRIELRQKVIGSSNKEKTKVIFEDQLNLLFEKKGKHRLITESFRPAW